MSMTKKDYELIASTIKELVGESWLTKDETRLLEVLVIRLQRVLEADNPKFDANKFHDLVYKD